MKEFKDEWRQTLRSCFFRPPGSTSTQARLRRSRKKCAETYAHKHINVLPAKVLCSGHLMWRHCLRERMSWRQSSRFTGIFLIDLSRDQRDLEVVEEKEKFRCSSFFLYLWNITQVSATDLFKTRLQWVDTYM
jgi:hypothetical protein